jgi:hypothetical protein
MKEQPFASLADAFWLVGYGFFAAHLLLTLRLNEGLIAELENGRYKITQKGLDMTGDLQSFNNIFEHHGFGGQKIEKSFDLLSYGYRYIISYVPDSFSSSFSVSSNCSPSSFGILLKLLLY